MADRAVQANRDRHQGSHTQNCIGVRAPSDFGEAGGDLLARKN